LLSTGEMPEWTQAVRGRVGAYLVDKLLQVATIRVGEDELYVLIPRANPITNEGCRAESHPAFYHSYDYYQGRRVGVIRVHPKVVTQMSKEPPQDQLYARHLPMLVPPRAWVGEDEGGYLFSKSESSTLTVRESTDKSDSFCDEVQGVHGTAGVYPRSRFKGTHGIGV
jgi:DNA-directed RNA polymerase